MQCRHTEERFTLCPGLHRLLSEQRAELEKPVEESKDFPDELGTFRDRPDEQILANAGSREEAVNNALRHGQAKTILIRLFAGEREGTLMIRDDGVALNGREHRIQVSDCTS